jgi:ACR3 family arsenite efflux pump ArsB
MGIELSNSFGVFLISLCDLAVALGKALVPWTPLLLWVVFWLFTVDWKKLVPILNRGGMLIVLAAGAVTVLAWSGLSQPAENVHSLYGLQVSNWVGKLVYVSGLIAIAFLSGSVQLTGIGRSWIEQNNIENQNSTPEC